MVRSGSTSSPTVRTRIGPPINTTSILCLVLTVAPILIAGCSVGPQYKRPLIDLRPYHNAPAIESPASTFPAPPASTFPAPPLDTWWTGFNDTELTNIIERALAQNLDLSASFARVQQAQAAAQKAGAGRKPESELTGSDAASRQSVATPI